MTGLVTKNRAVFHGVTKAIDCQTINICPNS